MKYSHTNPEKILPQKRLEKLSESLGRLIGEGFLTVKSQYMKKEKWLFFQMYRYQYRVTKNIKKQKEKSPKEQNTPIEISILPKKKDI